MQVIAYIVIALHVISAIGLIIFVLLHSGKGTGLSTMLGGAMPSTSTGTGIIEKNLDRITVGFGILYAVTAVVLMLVYRPMA
ncbi:preprotein translocase subunit SecG [Coriobacteriia bacterium Es71-Z0120]|uniref:preprotein translocase subunit SecG n=1 Tax=Parvivirga hydrogeniphila TaxID=2939460 RepID=UPI002260C9BC|nr:preprotein translocase subunit SecG [Parvivirga hydrogeniphila]MCL4078880.1 preprotein translocase subunit SecG [Parvivirga hydrogeniphila]